MQKLEGCKNEWIAKLLIGNDECERELQASFSIIKQILKDDPVLQKINDIL